MERRKVVLPEFDVETYSKDGDAVIDKLKDVEAAASEIRDKGYENIFLLGVGGTYDKLEPIQHIMDKYSEVKVHLSSAAELNVLRNKRLNKKSIVITASTSGDVREIIEAVEWIIKEGIDVMALAKPETPLGELVTMIVTTPVATGQCEYNYLMFDVLALRLLNRRGEFLKYDDFVVQIKNIFRDLAGIREKFDERADEIVKQHALVPYGVFVGSGALWGETVSFSMCILGEMQWVRTGTMSSPDFFHETLGLVGKDVPAFLFKGEDEYKKLDNHVEAFAKRFTDNLVIVGTAEYAIDGLDPEFCFIVPPMILTTLVTERLASCYKTYTKHNLAYRRYCRQLEYQSMDTVIFNMDDVLIDSEPIYMHHIFGFYHRFDIHVPYKEVVELAGSSHEAGLEMTSVQWRENITPSELEKLHEADSNEEIVYSEVLNPYVLYVLKRLKARGMKLAITSSSPKQAIVTMINECGLKGYFNEIISRHDFPYNKPDPSIYLYTLQKLNVAKERCVVTEDSTYGVLAAKAADVRVITKHDVRFGSDQPPVDYLIYDLLKTYHLVMQEGEATRIGK